MKSTQQEAARSDRASSRRFWPLWLVLVIMLIVAGCEVAGWPFLAGPVQRQLAGRMQRPVDIGRHFRLHWLGSIRVDTDALRIGPPQGLPTDSPLGGDLVDAREVHLRVPYATVMHLMRPGSDAPLRISSLRVGELNATLKRLADGRSNWALQQPDASAPGKPVRMPQFDELVLQQGHVVVDDAVLKTQVDATASTHEGQRGAVQSAGLVVQGQGKHDDRPLAFRVESAGAVPLLSRSHDVRVPISVRVQAGPSRFSFDGTGTDLMGFDALDGRVDLSGPSLARVGDSLGITLPTTEPFKLSGQLVKAEQVWSLKNVALAVGGSRLGGAFNYDLGPQVPMLTGELDASRFELADLLPAFGAPREGSGNPKPPPGRVLPQREFDIPSLRRMNARLRVRLAHAELGSIFRKPLAPLQADLSLQGGVLKLDNVLARAAGGEVKGALGLDSTTAVPKWSADLRWSGIDLDQWLRPRNAQSQVSKPSGENPGYVTGKLGGHAQLQAQGKSTAQMIGSTDGVVQAWIRNGTVSHLAVEVAGIDIAQALGVLVIGDNPLPMSCAVVKADAKNGTVTPEVAIVDTKDSTLLIGGSLSLAKESLDLVLTTHPKDRTPISLRSPVQVQGTFDHPRVHLEAKTLERKLLGAAALALINPLAGLIPLIDMGDKESAGGCERTRRQLRDADGPAGAANSKAPRAAATQSRPLAQASRSNR